MLKNSKFDEINNQNKFLVLKKLYQYKLKRKKDSNKLKSCRICMRVH